MNARTNRLARPALGLGAFALVALLGGCTLGPDYVRPAAPVADRWKELPPHKSAEPADTLPRGAWWSAFGDPLLDELMGQLVAANQSLVVAEANYRAAQAAIAIARAGLFPGVTGAVVPTRARRGANGEVTNSLSAAVNAQWELDLWGRVRRQVESAQEAAQASAADVAAARLSLETELAAAYLQLRVTDQARRILQETVDAYERSLALTQNRYAAGVAARSEVVQAETQLLSARASLIDVEATRAQFEHAVAALVGRPPSALSIAAVDRVPDVPAIPVELPSALLERRPDIAGAERRVAAANAEIGVATAAIYPTLTLSASGGFIGDTLANWLSLPNRVWSLGAAFAGTIFDAGQRLAQRDQAIAQYDATVGTYRQTVIDAFRDVEDNLAILRVLADEAGVQADAVRAARESVAVTTNQYRAGIVGYLNVVTVQAVALNAERVQVELQGRRLVAAANLVRALGGGFDATSLISAR